MVVENRPNKLGVLAMKLSRFLMPLLFVLAVPALSSNLDLVWVNPFTLPASFYPYNVLRAPSGNFYSIYRGGSSGQAGVVKFGTSGTNWTRLYYANGIGYANLFLDAEENSYFVGSWEWGGGVKIFLQCIQSDGTVAWTKDWQTKATDQNRAVEAKMDASGNIWILGTIALTTHPKLFLACFNGHGGLLHQFIYSKSDINPSGFQIDSAGAIVVDGTAGQNARTPFLLKYWPNRSVQYVELAAHQFDYPVLLQIARDDSVILGIRNTHYELVLRKFDSTLTPVWSQVHPNFDRCRESEMDSDGHVVIWAETPDNNNAVMKFDASGNLLWSRFLGPDLQPSKFIFDKSNRIIVFGAQYFENYAVYTPHVALFDTDGNEVTHFDLFSSQYPYDGAEGGNVDERGRVFFECYHSNSQQLVCIAERTDISPTTFSISPGRLVSGALADVFESDDHYVVMAPGVVLSSSIPPARIAFLGSLAGSEFERFKVFVESGAAIPGINQKLELYDLTSGTWQVVDNRLATTSDSSFSVSFDESGARFVEPGTNNVSARISWLPSGPLLFYPWTVRVDKFCWGVLP